MTYVVFILFSLMVLGGGLLVVTQRNIVHAAGALILALFGVAGLYVLLEAGFLAAVQILVYIGAIGIMIIFAIMLTRHVADSKSISMNDQWAWALAAVILVFGLLVYVVNAIEPVTAQAGAAPFFAGNATQELGIALLNPEGYVLPFEVASVLLLGAMVGAIVIAREKREE
ncbi:MAG: NADH-quinone oxidoreductase subunit J [Anaerolineales bacterium]|nr:NADH-quinone oxidoreductase subunit J [Anaerolineales bacterium]